MRGGGDRKVTRPFHPISRRSEEGERGRLPEGMRKRRRRRRRANFSRPPRPSLLPSSVARHNGTTKRYQGNSVGGAVAITKLSNL